MKLFKQLLLLALNLPIIAFAADTQTLMLPNSQLEIDSGAFWVRKWSMNRPTDVDLKSVTSFDSSLLLTFSGADFTYLNQQKATSFKKIGTSTYEWTLNDANLTYRRTYEVKNNAVEVSLNILFKHKAPEKAFLSMVTQGKKDDSEGKDREMVYFTNSKIERLGVNDEDGIEATEVATPVKWIGASTRYFLFTVLPETAPEKLLLQTTAPYNAQASLQFPVTNNQLSAKFKIAFIPKELDILRSVDRSLDTTVNLGFFTFIAYPILWALKFIYKYVGNYGIAIIILTLFIKILTFPLVLKSMKGMRKMAEFQPKMKALQEKYKNDKETFNREMMLLMKTSGYNPMAGCLPLVLQMPIFFALYSVLYAAVELYRAPFGFWLTDLSAKDPYFITPVLMSVVMFVQQRLTPPSPGMDPTQRKMMMYMPLVFGAFMLTTPSGLCVYMLVNAIASVFQQQYLNKKLGVSGNAATMATTF